MRIRRMATRGLRRFAALWKRWATRVEDGPSAFSGFSPSTTRHPGRSRTRDPDSHRKRNYIMQPPEMVGDLVIAAMPDDERVWVPQAPDVWFRPLMFNTVQGGWCNLLRV